jgi:hypothetical protein
MPRTLARRAMPRRNSLGIPRRWDNYVTVQVTCKYLTILCNILSWEGCGACMAEESATRSPRLEPAPRSRAVPEADETGDEVDQRREAEGLVREAQ